MTILADLTHWLPLSGASAALVVVIATLLVNGARAERDRRRELYARALQAVNAYYEMPFAIRRRRHEEDQRSAERVRLSDRFSEVQSELSTCQALMRADGDPKLAALYDELIGVARLTAGDQARKAWEADRITTDREVNMPAVREALAPVDAKRDAFVTAIEEAGGYLWQWQRPLDATT